MRIPIPDYRFPKKTKNFFRGGGSTALFYQPLFVNGRWLLIDQLVEQPTTHETADDEPRDCERGSVLSCRYGQCRTAHGPLTQEVNQDTQCRTRGQNDDNELAHDVCSVRFRCWFVSEWEPAFHTSLPM